MALRAYEVPERSERVVLYLHMSGWVEWSRSRVGVGEKRECSRCFVYDKGDDSGVYPGLGGLEKRCCGARGNSTEPRAPYFRLVRVVQTQCWCPREVNSSGVLV